VARDAERPKVYRTEIQALTKEEVQRLFDAAVGDRFECFYTLAVTCGLRAGENIGLRWSDINFDAGTLTVRRAIHTVKIKPLKSVRSYRVIKLSRTATYGTQQTEGESDGR
jgi:integrase